MALKTDSAARTIPSLSDILYFYIKTARNTIFLVGKSTGSLFSDRLSYTLSALFLKEKKNVPIRMGLCFVNDFLKQIYF